MSDLERESEVDSSPSLRLPGCGPAREMGR